jgi:hypothetical protein
MEEPLNTLVYKRTHTGDPDKSGIFGIHDCMGRVRRWRFDAVIGVGGKSPYRGHEDIALKINWIGISPSATEAPRGFRGPFVEFKCFVLLEEDGPYLKKLAPKLFRHIFDDAHVRFVMSRNLPDEMQGEVQKLLRWAAENHQPRKPPHVFEKTISTKRKC